ncbi:hypothetical protein HALA3H3_360110 [Halomonas sp. A3H3]|nr:hypothetical protein HALA3H3_360110 [Halomonas sp. A3H3]
MSEAGLKLAIAHLVVARVALRASTATANEWNRDAVAKAPLLYIFTNGFDYACQLMARHMGKLDIGVMPHPAMPVAAAYPVRHHLHHNAMRLRGGIRQLLDLWWSGKLLKNNGFHKEFLIYIGFYFIKSHVDKKQIIGR